jgi:NAD(P)-dependent dehydrogenase (short-subunit alcohol dehydrogenase family)
MTTDTNINSMTTDTNINSARGSGRLADRTAIVTGSTSGIGAAIASTLAREGAHVIVSGRDSTKGHTVVDVIVKAGGRADFLKTDLGGSYAGLRAFAADATSRLGGRVDLLVNNAGIYPVTATDQLPDDDLDAMLAINIRAPHVLVAEIAPAMADRGHAGDHQHRLLDGAGRQPLWRHVHRHQGRR